jgi:hypothetical protein
MRIVRENASEIVVQDSSVGFSVACGAVAAFLVVFALAHSQNRFMITGALFLLFALLFLRKSTFSFDRAAQSIRWMRLRMGRIQSGTIPFTGVQDICVEETGSESASTICRLSIQTMAGRTPMSDAYSVSHDYAAMLRATLVDFIRPGTAGAASTPSGTASATNADAARTQQVNESIRSLLAQGRKIDAILLVRQSDHLDLAEATFRVNQVASQMETKQPVPKS